MILDSFEAEENLPPTEIVYCNHCGVSIPEMERSRAVEPWNIESVDEEVSLDEGKAQPARELGIIAICPSEYPLFDTSRLNSTISC